VDRAGGEDQLTDELIGQVLERVRPRRPDAHGQAWRDSLAEEDRIKAWVAEGLTVVKIGILLGPPWRGRPASDLGSFRGGTLWGRPTIDNGPGG